MNLVVCNSKVKGFSKLTIIVANVNIFVGDKIIIDDWVKYFIDISEERLPCIY